MTPTDRDAASRPDIEKALGIGKSGPSRLRRFFRFLIYAVIIGAVGTGLYFVWAGGRTAGTISYITDEVTRTDLKVIVTATGSVQPINEVDVSSELSGTVKEVFVDYNDPVAEGQVLAVLDTDKLKATVDSSRAQLAAARAKVKNAEATLNESRLDYERKKALVDRAVVSAQDLDVAKANFDRAKAAVDSALADVAVAAADVKLNETNLSKANILSPISGIVLQRDVEPGQTVASSLQAPVLFTLAEDLAKMQVEVDVDEADVGRVAPGQKATFTVDAYPEKHFPALIEDLRYGSEVVQGVVTYKAVLATDNGDLLLRPGMTATAEIVVQELTDIVTVPNEALRFSPPVEEEAGSRSLIQMLMPGAGRLRKPSKQAGTGTDRTVWVLTGGQPQAVPVKVGPSDGSRTQVVEGDLDPGQDIIVDTATGVK